MVFAVALQSVFVFHHSHPTRGTRLEYDGLEMALNDTGKGLRMHVHFSLARVLVPGTSLKLRLCFSKIRAIFLIVPTKSVIADALSFFCFFQRASGEHG